MPHVAPNSWVAIATYSATAWASRLAHRAPGDSLQERSLLCPVVCDETWCCQIGQICQEVSDGDAPYECGDLLLETTDSAFALVALSSEVNSVLSEGSALITSLTSELSLSLTFTETTSPPDPNKETMVPETSPSKPSRPSTTTTTSSTETETTTASEDAAVTPNSPWQHRIAVAGLAMALAF
ncbi:hypothetical protein ACRE_024740 [Hapsidospora chrysogenum ATCC 11550]|uniref:Uncharacterized protein n=1 Tax=Hapsidospora chrysogenum (strain ATCC 11550 / CBS 779.69 / DSM 880 / IAM 14645 / JCM 23072 / IMI 49137) TaxID=857340 RepID=A0A086TBP8_HAPC1|nr:hypothetical protein ACRE_024740 [Hapsidospora chrysogenum ATCC 11550]